MKMTKKQKQRVVRILITLVLFFLLLAGEKTGALEGITGFPLFLLYFIPYLIVGYDVLIRSAKNISHGQVFDENFLMMIATFAFFSPASSTSSRMRATVEFSYSFSTRTRSTPCPFTAPEKTSSPLSARRGTLSPVSADVSRKLSPSSH